MGDHFKVEIDTLLDNSVAPSTARQYDVALKCFTEFRFLFGIEDIWPVPLQDIIGFIAHMFKKGLSYSTVNCYISGLSFYNKINNYENHTQMFIVRKMIDGIKRTTFKKDARLPITRDLFCRILGVLQSVCSNIYESNLFKAAFCLAFFGLFSVGELTETKGCESKHVIKVDSQINTRPYRNIFNVF